RVARRRLVAVTITGGVPIHPSRSRAALWSAGFAVLWIGALLARPTHPVMVVAAWLLLAMGVVALAGSALGRMPAGYLQFDPEGITFGCPSWRYVVPWDGIRSAAPAQRHGHPILLIQLVAPGVVRASPASCQARAARCLRSNARWQGAPVAIMPGTYGVDLPV